MIDDVIKSIRADYQENGVEDDVLVYLQQVCFYPTVTFLLLFLPSLLTSVGEQRWEANLVETRVATFEEEQETKPAVNTGTGSAGGSAQYGYQYGVGGSGTGVKTEVVSQEELLRLRGGVSLGGGSGARLL